MTINTWEDEKETRRRSFGRGEALKEKRTGRDMTDKFVFVRMGKNPYIAEQNVQINRVNGRFMLLHLPW